MFPYFWVHVLAGWRPFYINLKLSSFGFTRYILQLLAPELY
jgi:hypothetical protein